MHPETDHDFRNRILQVADPDLRADAMVASGYGLDGLGSLCGLERKGVPDGERVNPIVEAFRIVEQERALEAAIVRLAPGERPTEPGWYVTNEQDEYEMIVRVATTYDGEFRERLCVFFIDSDCRQFVDETDLTFIARIYPDRIQGREG